MNLSPILYIYAHTHHVRESLYNFAHMRMCITLYIYIYI